LYSRDSSGSFTRVGTLDTGNGTVRLLAAELDGSGLDALVVLNSLDSTVSIYLPDGSGGYLGPQVVQVPAGASDLALDPFASGPPTLLAPGRAPADVNVLINDGYGIFSFQHRYRAANGLFGYDASLSDVASSQATSGLVAADFRNVTGNIDVVTINPGTDT